MGYVCFSFAGHVKCLLCSHGMLSDSTAAHSEFANSPGLCSSRYACLTIFLLNYDDRRDTTNHVWLTKDWRRSGRGPSEHRRRQPSHVPQGPCTADTPSSFREAVQSRCLFLCPLAICLITVVSQFGQVRRPLFCSTGGLYNRHLNHSRIPPTSLQMPGMSYVS
jgi:hypothetical protein